MHVDTAELPDGWRNRLVSWTVKSSDPATPKFIEAHDLVLSKLAAGRGKDLEFATSLLDAQLVDLGILFQRTELLPSSGERVMSWLQAYARRRH